MDLRHHPSCVLRVDDRHTQRMHTCLRHCRMAGRFIAFSAKVASTSRTARATSGVGEGEGILRIERQCVNNCKSLGFRQEELIEQSMTGSRSPAEVPAVKGSKAVFAQRAPAVAVRLEKESIGAFSTFGRSPSKPVSDR